jgi:predicted ester cyclase
MASVGLDDSAALPGEEYVMRYYPPVHDEARASFGERRHQPAWQVAERDMVVTTVDVTLKHTGPFAGIAPTGNEIHTHQVFIHRLRDGKITDVWSYGDFLGMLRQLGVTVSFG